MTNFKPQITLVEELKSSSVDPLDPTKLLHEGKSLSSEIKDRLKDFLCRDLDIFTWRHEDMVGIDPKVDYHHLKIDPTVAPHRLKNKSSQSGKV